MITPDWRRPTREEAAKGYIAMEKQIYYCQLENGTLMKVDYSGGYVDKQGKFVPRTTRWAGLTAQMIERRIRHEGSLPKWIEVRQSAKIAA